MSIDQTGKIDFISTSPEEKVILTISDHLEWDVKRKFSQEFKFPGCLWKLLFIESYQSHTNL